MDKLEQHIESIIFSSEQPISLKDIKACLEQSMDSKIKNDLLEKAMEGLSKKYEGEAFAFEIIEISGGYQFLTKGAYHHTIGTLLKQKAKKRLSKAALETLAIIAYKQPVTKSGAEAIRGVSCDYSIQKLLEKELISIEGRSEGPGKPLLYATSPKFMDYFGLKTIKDLPKLKEFTPDENTIGDSAALEEVIQENPKKEENDNLKQEVENLPPTDEDSTESLSETIVEIEEIPIKETEEETIEKEEVEDVAEQINPNENEEEEKEDEQG